MKNDTTLIPSRRRLLRLGVMATAGALIARWLPGQAVPVNSETFPVSKSDTQWRAQLTPAQYGVLREEGTERPYSSPLDHEKRGGTFACVACANPLFSSRTKFDSGTGWPSFYKPLPKAVGERRDSTLGMVRTEVHCANCGGHLGHVFDDGPAPTGLRYCMNGVALTFQPMA